MHTSWVTWRARNLGFGMGAALLLCAATGCSRSSPGNSRALDGAVDGLLATGGTAAGSGSGASTSSMGGAGGGALTATTSRTGGATSVGGTSPAGGRSGLAGTSGAGGAVTGGSASLRDAGVGGGGLGGSHASGGGTSGLTGAGGSSSAATGGNGGSVSGGAGGHEPDAGIATTPDASPRGDGSPGDMPTYRDFGVIIAGTWLVGWSSGDARHYSWVRLGGQGAGTAEYLSGADIPSNTPFCVCDGSASWFTTAAPYAIMLRFPASCSGDLRGYFTFRALSDTAVAPPGATFGMVSDLSSQPSAEWWRYPDDQCDAAMSACKSPF